MRLLFLCNNYHPLSVACLESLHAAGRFEISVGQLRRNDRGINGLARAMWRRYGLTETIRRAQRFAVAAARIKARDWGLPLPGCRTIQEFLRVHPLDELYFENFNSPLAVNALRERSFDIFVAGAFSQILGPELLAVPRLGALNVHLSLLPKYRGPLPCYWVVKNRERTTGVTVHFMDPKIDAGDIVLQREIPVHPGESPAQLERRLAPLGAELLVEALTQIESATARRIPQRDEDATYHSFPGSR